MDRVLGRLDHWEFCAHSLGWERHLRLRVCMESCRRSTRNLGRLPLGPILIELRVSMALIGANELKKKMLIEIDGQPYNVLDVFFATPTARGASTMVRTRLRNLLNGSVLEKSFKTSEKFPEPDVQLASVSFLYNDSDGFHFMDQSTYEQFTISEESIGDDRWYLKE